MEVRHDEQNSSFTLDTGHGAAVLSYSRSGDGTLDLRHTLVPEKARNRGVGGQLVAGALEHARRAGLRVKPTCPFVRAWLESNPGHDDLIHQEESAPG